MESPERYEQLLAFLGSHLPQPVDQRTDAEGAVQFLGGDPPEVVALVTASSVIVFEFDGVWESAFKFAARPRRVGLLKWKRLPESAMWTALNALIKGAREARQARFQVCRYCGRTTAPEWLHDEGVCQSCGEQHGGAIH